MPSYRRYLLPRLLLACAAACLSGGLLAGQASAAAPPCADLQIENIVVSPTNPVQGLTANIAITIHNGGTCAAGGFVTQFRTSLSSPTGPSESISSLFPGESKTLNLPFVFTAAGNYEAVVETDTGHAVSETNEENNLEILPITVLPPGVNLVLEKFSVAPVATGPTIDPTNSVVQGRAAIASITVTNTGNVPAGPFVVQWTPYAFAKPLTQSVSGLEPGETKTVEMEYTFPFAGKVKGTAVVDSTNAVKETDELDNSATLETVVQPPLPNLRVAPEGIHVHAAPAGSTSTIEVEVENDGNNPAGDFVVTWKPGPLIAAQSQQVNGLGVGGHTTVIFHNVYTLPGSYNGTVTLDSTHVVAEVTENDNTASTVVNVPAATVDLTITSMSIRPTEEDRGDLLKSAFAAATVTQGSANTLTLMVKNLGNSPSPSFVTSWNPSAFSIIVPGNQTLTQETGPLGPGEERELTFSFTYPKPGNFRSVADVDAFNTVKETNEANNERILNVTVQPAPIDLVFVGPIVFNPAQPVRGVKATATVTIRNDGPIATEAFAVQLIPQEGGFPQTQFVNGLNVGEERTLTFPVTYSKKGQFKATAVIDPFNQVVKTKTPDELTQTVTVVPPVATVRATLDSLHVLSNGTSTWNPIIFGVFDATKTCHVSAYGQSVDIPKLACQVTTKDGVNSGDTVTMGLSVDVTLVDGAPLVGAVVAANETSICVIEVIVCLKHVSIPNVRGFAALLGFAPAYAPATTPVSGLGCLESDFKTADNKGHCFDANFSTTVLSANYPLLAPAAARASAAAATWTEVPGATKRIAKERAYLTRALKTAQRQLRAAAKHAHKRAGGAAR